VQHDIYKYGKGNLTGINSIVDFHVLQYHRRYRDFCGPKLFTYATNDGVALFFLNLPLVDPCLELRGILGVQYIFQAALSRPPHGNISE
jgi:hypothetical protein